MRFEDVVERPFVVFRLDVSKVATNTTNTTDTPNTTDTTDTIDTPNTPNTPTTIDTELTRKMLCAFSLGIFESIAQ